MATYNLSPTRDAHIRGDAPTSNYNSNAGLGVGEANNSSALYRALLHFDLSGIGAGETVTSATLKLYRGSDLSDNARRFNCYRVRRAWTTGVTWNTWNGSDNWTTAGCGDTTNDRESTVLGYRDMSGAETLHQECQFPLNAAMVDAWRAGTFANNGLIIIAETENNDCIIFRSQDYAEAEYRPILTVETSAGGTPATVNAVAASASTTASAPSPSAAVSLSVPVATSSGSSVSASLSAGASMPAIPSSASASASAPYAGAAASVAGSVALSSVYAGAPTIAASAQVVGDSAGASASAPAPTVSAGESIPATIYAPCATLSASATVAQIFGGVAVSAATAASYAGALSASLAAGAITYASVASASASAPAPTVDVLLVDAVMLTLAERALMLGLQERPARLHIAPRRLELRVDE